jgi:hypothetical protein
MSHDGRVTAKRPGADLSGNGDDEATVWPEKAIEDSLLTFS